MKSWLNRNLSVHPTVALVRHSLQLPLWFLLTPTRWGQCVQAISPHLAPHFALAELGEQDLRKPALRNLLLTGYVILPLLVSLALILLYWATGRLTLLILLGILYGWGLGLLFGWVVSAATGVIVLVMASVALSAVWSKPDVMVMDMMVDVRFALVFGLINMVTVHVSNNLLSQASTVLDLRRALRQLGSFVLALLAGLTIFLIAVYSTERIATARGVGAAADQAPGLMFSGIPALLLGFCVHWRTGNWRRGMRSTLLFFVAAYTVFGDIGSQLGRDVGQREMLISFGLITFLTYYFFFVLPYVLLERLIGAWGGILAGVLSTLAIYPALNRVVLLYVFAPNLLLGLLLTLLGLTMHWWRPLLTYPLQAVWNTLLLRSDEQRSPQQASLLRWHSAFWDELQFLPLYGLDEHLVLVMERNPDEGAQAMETISSGRQRWAAQVAQIELYVRRLSRCRTPGEIAVIATTMTMNDLEGPASALLRSLVNRSHDVAAALEQTSSYNQRLSLTAIAADLDNFLRELTRSNEPYALHFQPVIVAWRRIVSEYAHALAEIAELRQEIPNPYIVGPPLTKQQSIFVGRTDISLRIEELLSQQDYPPLLLYGQRRMGKTSLLMNLRWLLPNRIVPLVVDLQGPVSLANHHIGFLYNFAKGIALSAAQQGIDPPELPRATLTDDPFTVFDDWLDGLERVLIERQHTTILLALDEFESLDEAFVQKRLDTHAVLSFLRHVIQHRRRFKLLLAGSHSLHEFRRWSSYLINAQTVYLGYLQESEARQLIEQPIQGFPLVYERQAVQHILTLTRRHPFLVQLLCSELVNAKNEQAPDLRRRVTLADVESITQQVLMLGSQFFADIESNQISASGVMLLRFLARQGAERGATYSELTQQFVDQTELQATLTTLVQRELIEEVNGCFRFQVELIRRWFAQPSGLTD